MTLTPNTKYVYEFGGDMFITHHVENNKLYDYKKLVDCYINNICTNWTYDPSYEPHAAIIFHELEAYKLQHPELLI